MPGVKFDELSQSYDQEQSARIVKYAQRIAARDNAISAGRVVPEDGDLPIGTGGRLSAAGVSRDRSCRCRGRQVRRQPFGLTDSAIQARISS